ncbi:MAG: purine-nucleoside phosphorylase [Acidimicrobiia bacterium]|nr:purine-nucleoside phosphorylase [Acidimicrobiia bacterium]
MAHAGDVLEPFASAQAAAARIAELTGVARHDVAVVLGSGWAPAADALGEPEHEVGFDELSGFPVAAVLGHAGRARSLRIGSRRVLVLLGRSHLYEGHEPAAVVHGVRTAIFTGCSTVVLTNAAGGLRADMAVGDAVLIADHLNLTGRSPMSGLEPPAPFGARFVDLTAVYSARLRALAQQLDPSLREAVYCGLPGPHYETPAEVEMVRRLGGDLVGMSTVLEAIAARHLGAEVLAFSLVTNLAAGLGAGLLDHQEVLAEGTRSARRMGSLLAQLIAALD